MSFYLALISVASFLSLDLSSASLHMLMPMRLRSIRLLEHAGAHRNPARYLRVTPHTSFVARVLRAGRTMAVENVQACCARRVR